MSEPLVNVPPFPQRIRSKREREQGGLRTSQRVERERERRDSCEMNHHTPHTRAIFDS
jgi:hypothetical protein